MAKKPPTFEESLKRLEDIAREIEEGKIGLEESIVRYEEGMKLVQQCRAILAGAEQKIRQLQPSPDGGLESVPFEPGERGADAEDDATDTPY
jgi:exodeoxyribonuclease VII small subunit